MNQGALAARGAGLAEPKGLTTVVGLLIVSAFVMVAVSLFTTLVSEDSPKSASSAEHGQQSFAPPMATPALSSFAYIRQPQAIPYPGTSLVFADPRTMGGRSDVGVIGFSRVSEGDVVEALCGSGFLGTSWDLGPEGLLVAPRDYGSARPFRNAEAAYQALAMWDQADAFRTLSGSQAQELAREFAMDMDVSFSGYDGSWQAMFTVLRAKFRPGSVCADALLRTGDAFLIEHDGEQGLDRMWAGDGTNWLGLQLMVLRDELRSLSGSEAVSSEMTWTEFACEQCWIDLATGGQFAAGGDIWQNAVRSATSALLLRLALNSGERREGV